MNTQDTDDVNVHEHASIARTVISFVLAIVTGVLAGVFSLALMWLQLIALLNLAIALFFGWPVFVPMVLLTGAWAVYLYRLWDSLPLESMFALDSVAAIKTRKWLILGTLGHVVFCAVLVSTAIFASDSRAAERTQRFEARIADIREGWDDLFKPYPGRSASAAPSQLHGVMIVNLDSREWEPVVMQVSEQKVATSRSELRYLIRVRRAKGKVLRTESGRSASQNVCRLEIIDFQERRLVFETILEGSMPTAYRRRRTTRLQDGSDPLRDWLTANGLLARNGE